MGDDAWRNQPKRMSEAVQVATVRQLAETLCFPRNTACTSFSMVENPLLIGPQADVQAMQQASFRLTYAL